MTQKQNSIYALSALERISDGVFSLNIEGQITYINTAAINLFEVSGEDSIGKKLEQLFHKEIKEKVEPKIVRAVEQESNSSFEVQYSEQPLKWLEIHVYPSSDGVTLFVSDITSRKQVETALEEKQEKLILLSEAANHLLFTKEPKELLDALFNDLAAYLDLDVYFNYIYDELKEKLRLMNYSGIPEEVAKEIEWLELGEATCGCVALNRQMIIAVNIDTSDDERVQLVKEFGIKAYACHPLMSYGKMIGTLSFGSSKRSSFSDEELDLLYTICNQVANIFDRTFLISELTHKKEEAEKANNAKSDFISMMSHELRTPLNSIIGFAQILEDDVRDPMTKGQIDKIKKVLKSSRHLLKLINDILETVRFDTGKTPLIFEPINMDTFMRESIKMIQPLAVDKGVAIHYLMELNSPLIIKADSTRLTQVMINLLSNAVKYTPQHGKITVSYQVVDNQVKVVVADSGIGIPSDEQEKIFTSFYRIFNREMNIEGAGIGLAIVKHLVRDMGGEVGVLSTPGEGSRFWFTLPIHEEREWKMNQIKLLLADDHSDSLEIIKYFLSDLPEFQLIGQCENGNDLVDQVLIKKPDLVLTDINMPMKNGFQAIKECLRFYPNLKVIFVTGYDDFAIEAFEIAAVDYIVKPIEKIRLFQALEKAKDIISFEQGKRETHQGDLNRKVLPLKDHTCTRFIPLADIYFIEKIGKKCLVYTKTEIYETNETIGRILTRLGDNFFQAHRSYIINLQEVTQITQLNETFIASFKDYDKHAGISKLKINEVKERISI
jgi:PAS domain S-box-containing protein